MTNSDLHPQLASHLQRQARRLYGLACGFGRQRDAEDIIQTLYARWWRRLRDEPTWSLPETHAELFVCVRRVVIDVVAKEKRDRLRHDQSAGFAQPPGSQEESLHAFERLQWILSRMPAPLAEALTASLSAGRQSDAEVASELGVTTATFTARLFKARRAAEELAAYYESLPLDQATLLAELRFGGKSRAELARELGVSPDEVRARAEEALASLEKNRRAAS